MAQKPCSYTFRGPDGENVVLRGMAAIKAFLASGGLEYLRGMDVRKSRARDVTETPEFKKWFGDSKVVDADGKPLVVYHGTTADFAEFKTGKRGAFFASSPDGASAYAGGEAGSNVIPAYLSIKNPYTGHVGRRGPEIGEVIDKAKRGGHDGAIVTYDDFPGERAFVAFRPKQIKSAIGNTGAFETDNPDITRSSERDLDNFRKETLGRISTNVAMAKMRGAGHDWAFNVGDQLLSTKTGKVYTLTGRIFQRVGKLSANDWQPVYYYTTGKPPPANATREERDAWNGPYEQGIFPEKSVLESKTLKSLTTPIMRSTERPWYSQLERAIEGVPARLDNMAAPQWAQWLKANASKLGVSDDDVQRSGASIYLRAVTGKVPKADIVGYLDWAAEVDASGIDEPRRIIEQAKDFFGGWKPPRESLNAVVNSGVISSLDNDQVAEAVVQSIPVDVMNVLADQGFTAEKFARKPQVLINNLPADARLAVANGVADALSQAGALLRAGLNAARQAGLDVEVLPALRARDLESVVAARALLPELVPVGPKVLSGGDRVRFAGARPAAVDGSISALRIGGERGAAVAADFADFHRASVALLGGDVPKSAITPAMREKAAGGMPLFSRERDADPVYKEMAADEELIAALEIYMTSGDAPEGELNDRLVAYMRRLPPVPADSYLTFYRNQPSWGKPWERGWASWTTNEDQTRFFGGRGFEVLRRKGAQGVSLERLGEERSKLTGEYHQYGSQAEWLLLNESVFSADAIRSRERTETPEFKAWFKDSKVVDDSGRPMVMYHGTSRGGFAEFDRNKTLEWRGPSMDTVGSWFSNNPSEKDGAGLYAAGGSSTIYPVYLSIQNPKIYRTFNDFLRHMHRAAGRPMPEQAPGRGSTEELRADLEADGYDGIQFWQTANESLMEDIREMQDAVKRAKDDEFSVKRADRLPYTQKRERLEQTLKSMRNELDEFGSSTEFDGQRVFVAFEPAQIKSVIGNDGSFDDNDPNILSSAARNWASPGASKFDDVVYKLQDKQVDLKRIVEAVKDARGEIRNDIDTYLQEELFHGRAAKRTEDFVNKELQPLVEEMAKRGLTIEDLDEYLHARHAPEANRLIAERNPDSPLLQDGGSGLDTALAQQYMADLAADKKAHLEAAAAMVDKMLAKTRKLVVDYELEGKDTVNGWGEMFDHYVPLMREDDGDAPQRLGTGQGFSIKGREVKSRTGSTKKVVDILANIAMQRERTIVRGEKNRVAQSLVGLASANPNKDFWTVDLTPTTPTFDPKKGVVVQRPDPMFKARPNVVVAKIREEGGSVKEHAVIFSEKDGRALRTATAMKNLDAAQLEGLMGASATITRYFAAVNTQYNPVFGIVNLVRDVQGALINLQTTELAGKQKAVAKNTLSALRGIYSDARAVRGGKSATSAWASLWEDFQDVGGQTGFRQLFATSNDRAEAIQKALNPDSWMDSGLGKIFTARGTLRVPMKVAMKGARWIFDWLSDYNLAMENGIRLATYKAGLDAGMSKERAASLAKNLTVNFNRKGQIGQQAGAVYAFFNASMQGTARLGQVLFDMEPGKPKTMRLSGLGKKVVYGGITLGSMQALALAAAGFDDNDPPDFARERALIIPTGGKTYISIPMPLGFHVIPGVGRMTTEWALGGFKDTPQRVVKMLGMFADTFNPIGNAGLSMQTLAPTALDPLVALTENKDWQGRPIAKESMNKAVPGHALARDTATAWARLMSEAVNAATGGNEHVAGAISPTPDQIDYLIGQVTGGVGRELSKVEQSAKSAVTGEELPLFKIPVVGRFVGSAASQSSEGNAFYANSAELNKLETEIKGLQRDGKATQAAALRSSRPDAYLIAQVNAAERDIAKLRRQKTELVKGGADRAQVRQIEERITARMAAFNKAAEALKQRAPAT